MYLGGEVCEGAHLRAEHGVGFVEAAVGGLVGLSAGLRRMTAKGRQAGQRRSACRLTLCARAVRGRETHLQGDAEVY